MPCSKPLPPHLQVLAGSRLALPQQGNSFKHLFKCVCPPWASPFLVSAFYSSRYWALGFLASGEIRGRAESHGCKIFLSGFCFQSLMPLRRLIWVFWGVGRGAVRRGRGERGSLRSRKPHSLCDSTQGSSSLLRGRLQKDLRRLGPHVPSHMELLNS